jgi:hypothetical protein
MTSTRSKDTPPWRHVRNAREKLLDCANYPVLDSLEEAWLGLESVYGSIMAGGKEYNVVDRRDLERTSEGPLTTLMFMTEMGIYPPPELLLGLLDSWRDYLEACGEKTLEEVFLGRPRRKAGNYAKRDGKKWTQRVLAGEFAKLVERGSTQAAAAEEITVRYGLRMDPESFIRMARKNLLFGLRGKNKRVNIPGKATS